MARTGKQKRANAPRTPTHGTPRPALKHTPAQPSNTADSARDGASSARTAVWVAALVTVAGLAAVTVLRGNGSTPEGATQQESALQREREARAADGPAWPGELDARGIELPIPAGYVRASECVATPEPWRFPGMTRDQVTALARDAHLPPTAADALAEGLRCETSGCEFTASWEVLGALAAEPRSAFYRALHRLPGNRLQLFAFQRPRALGAWSDMPTLSTHVRAALARGTWSLDEHHAFSDQPWLCAQLTTDAERVEALRALRTRYGLDVSVRVPAQGDLTPLVRYWSLGNDPDAVRSVLVDARSHGGLASVAALLPAMARARLNRFPAQDALEYDCFWTAARFFEGTAPSEHFPGPQGIIDLVRDHYAQVPSAEARLGDIVAFVDPDGTFSHTATQVAGDVIFTKNGRSHQRPWVLMNLDDVRAMYPHVHEVRWYRRRAAP